MYNIYVLYIYAHKRARDETLKPTPFVLSLLSQVFFLIIT